MNRAKLRGKPLDYECAKAHIEKYKGNDYCQGRRKNMAIGSETQKEISSLQLQIGKCLAKGYKTQAKPLIKRLNRLTGKDS